MYYRSLCVSVSIINAWNIVFTVTMTEDIKGMLRNTWLGRLRLMVWCNRVFKEQKRGLQMDDYETIDYQKHNDETCILENTNIYKVEDGNNN